MASREPKTKKTKASVADFIDAVEHDTRRADAKALDRLFREVTGEKPAMWGPTMIGYGSYEGPTGTWMRTGFSPRAASLVLYVLTETDEMNALLARLGKHKNGKSCLYITKLSDVDAGVLRKIVESAWAHMAAAYPR